VMALIKLEATDEDLALEEAQFWHL
jgi:hypothetical protein